MATSPIRLIPYEQEGKPPRRLQRHVRVRHCQLPLAACLVDRMKGW